VTEREYIEAIRTAAQNYVNTIRGIDFQKGHVTRWQMIKEGLSPQTMIMMCNLALGEEHDAVHRS